ncbi:MAG: hypothetical protein RR214_04695, partial [Synergistaceae bacterium]
MVRNSAKIFKHSMGKFVMYGVLVTVVLAAVGTFAAKKAAWGEYTDTPPMVISADVDLSKNVNIKDPEYTAKVNLTAQSSGGAITANSVSGAGDPKISYKWEVIGGGHFAVISPDTSGDKAVLAVSNITDSQTGLAKVKVVLTVSETDKVPYSTDVDVTVANAYEITNETRLGDGFAPFHKWNQQYPLVTLVIKDNMPVYSLTVKDGHRVAIYDNGANSGWNGTEDDREVKDNMYSGRFKGGITVSGGGVVEFHRSEFVEGPVTVGERGTFANYYGTRVLVNGDFKIDSDAHDASRIRIGDDAGIAGRVAGLLQIEGSFKANDGKSDRKIPNIYMYNLSRLRVKGVRMDGDFNFTVYNHPQNIINAIFWQQGRTRWYAEYINGNRTPLQSISPVHMEFVSAAVIDAVNISKDVAAVGTKSVITETSGDSSSPGSGDVKFKLESADVYAANISSVGLSTYTGTVVTKIAALPVINAASIPYKAISSGSAGGLSSASAVNEGGRLFLLTMPISNDVISGDKPIDNTSILVAADRTGYLHLA